MFAGGVATDTLMVVYEAWQADPATRDDAVAQRLRGALVDVRDRMVLAHRGTQPREPFRLGKLVESELTNALEATARRGPAFTEAMYARLSDALTDACWTLGSYPTCIPDPELTADPVPAARAFAYTAARKWAAPPTAADLFESKDLNIAARDRESIAAPDVFFNRPCGARHACAPEAPAATAETRDWAALRAALAAPRGCFCPSLFVSQRVEWWMVSILGAWPGFGSPAPACDWPRLLGDVVVPIMCAHADDIYKLPVIRDRQDAERRFARTCEAIRDLVETPATAGCRANDRAVYRDLGIIVSNLHDPCRLGSEEGATHHDGISTRRWILAALRARTEQRDDAPAYLRAIVDDPVALRQVSDATAWLRCSSSVIVSFLGALYASPGHVGLPAATVAVAQKDATLLMRARARFPARP